MISWRRFLGCLLCAGCVISASAVAQVVTEFSAGITANSNPIGITAGPDGNLWFAERHAQQIGRITPLGVITEFSAGISVGAFPEGITAGPDGNLWFTETATYRIGRITPLGAVTEFSNGITGGADPIAITRNVIGLNTVGGGTMVSGTENRLYNNTSNGSFGTTIPRQ